MAWSDPQDVLRRRQIKKLSNKELSDQLAKIRKRLNSRMRSLERTGYADYSGSYERLVTYIKEDLGGYRNKKGQFEFTSKPYAQRNRTAREELLLKWEHKLSYEGLKTEEVRAQLRKEAKRLNEKTETTEYNEDRVKRIRDMMKEWREEMSSSVKELFDSKSARAIFEEKTFMTNEQRANFLIDMENTFYDKEAQQLRPEMKDKFPAWIKNYNFAAGRSELEYGHVFFNPATGEIYDGETSYKMEIDTSTTNKVYYLVDGNERINIDRDIGEENLYDFLFKFFG